MLKAKEFVFEAEVFYIKRSIFDGSDTFYIFTSHIESATLSTGIMSDYVPFCPMNPLHAKIIMLTEMLSSVSASSNNPFMGVGRIAHLGDMSATMYDMSISKVDSKEKLIVDLIYYYHIPYRSAVDTDEGVTA